MLNNQNSFNINNGGSKIFRTSRDKNLKAALKQESAKYTSIIKQFQGIRKSLDVKDTQDDKYPEPPQLQQRKLPKAAYMKSLAQLYSSKPFTENTEGD